MIRRIRLSRASVGGNIIGNAFHKLDVLEKNLSKHHPEDNIIQFSHIVKKFFSGFFSLRYKFTYDELSEELSRKKIEEELKSRLLSFISGISLLEFSGVAPSDEKLVSMSRSFREALLLLEKSVLKDEKKEKMPFFHIRFGIRRDKAVKYDGRVQAALGEEIYNLLLSAHRAVESNDCRGAAEDYKRISADYEKLSPENKKKVHSPIIEFYQKFVSSCSEG
ncbi:MAG: hypothetical protein NTV63_04990 [Candidatus Woesearchaeota archaeon]|nr:hypothetical protein [Candidatus Woesearchaeota archaeon]